MILDRQRKYSSYKIAGAPGHFSATPSGIKVSTHAFSYSVCALREQLGDYGNFTDSKEFCYEGNLFADLESLSLKVDVTPRQHEISSKDHVTVWNRTNERYLDLYNPRMQSLPSNDDLKSLLTSLSTRLTNRYLITRVIQYSKDSCSSTMACLYSVAKPFTWYRNESAGSPPEARSGDELRGEIKGDHRQVRVDDIDEIKS